MTAGDASVKLVDEAADWFARRRSGQMSLQEVRELEVWLESDASHRSAFHDVGRVWVKAHLVATDPEILAIREAAMRHFTRRRRFYAAGSALAITAVFCVLLYVAGLTGLWRDWVSPISDQRYQTAIGQTMTVLLADGSSVVLDSDTALAVHETWRRRDLTLEHGQAYFHVAKDPARPFVVSAAGSSVMATGTAFDVRLDPGRLMVLLDEGRLHIDIAATASVPAQQTNMVAGWRLTASSSGERALTAVNSETLAHALEWRTGHLTFVGQSVATVAAELNRYSQRKVIVLSDLAATPIDGVFRTADIDGFVSLLVKSHLARVLDSTDAEITLTSLKKDRLVRRVRVQGF